MVQCMATHSPLLRRHHTATVIMVHGIMGTSERLASVIPHTLPYVKWIFPQSPTRFFTLAGIQGNIWFDVDRPGPLTPEEFQSGGGEPFDPVGTTESVNFLKDIIAREVKEGIPTNRIVVGGISQGGHLALKTALTHSPSLGGGWPSAHGSSPPRLCRFLLTSTHVCLSFTRTDPLMKCLTS